MQINPKATYKIGKLRSDSRVTDPDPVIIQPRVLPGTSLTQMGIMDWQQFFTANPLNYKQNTTLEVFQTTARGELKHVYSGTILSGFGFSLSDPSMNNGFSPMPIGGNSFAQGGFHGGRGYAANDSMREVFSHAEITMQNMQTRHEAEIDRVNRINEDLRAEITRQMQRAANAEAEARTEREGRLKAEAELERVRIDYTLKEQYRKEMEENAVKLAKDYVQTQQKTSSALNDGTLNGIMGLLAQGAEFMRLVNGEPPKNQMQTSVPVGNTAASNGVGDGQKQAAPTGASNGTNTATAAGTTSGTTTPSTPQFQKTTPMKLNGAAPSAPPQQNGAPQQYATVAYK